MEKKMQQPRVLVGCPTAESHAYCLKDYTKAVKGLSYPNYDILLVDNSEGEEYAGSIKKLGLPVVRFRDGKTIRDRIINCRNILRQKVLDGGYDYFLSLEQDVIPPKDVIEQLLSVAKPFVSGVYFAPQKFMNGNKLRPLIWANYDRKKDIMYYINDKFALESKETIEICASGLGCALIHKSILEKFQFRYVKEIPSHDDMWFCRDLRDNNIKMFANLNVKCKHMLSKREWTWKEKMHA